MKQIDIVIPSSIPVVACPQCSVRMRLYGIEPHICLARTELHTYLCEACDRTETLVVPLARHEAAPPPAS